ncbi:unnamed protein product, partial [Mesorhabditis belari]|uniref:G protein-coupled receptor n=1 Tax=Mesorhabditis belari TaxID=2138241 RepID=A0AAF3F3H9_9BILA
MDSPWGQLISAFGFTMNLVATVLNGLGIWCIFGSTPNSMRNYSILLLQTTVADFLASGGAVYSNVRLVAEGGKRLGAIIIPEGPCKYQLSSRSCQIGYCMMLGSNLHSLLSLPMSFFYRWWVISHPAPKKYKIFLALLATAPMTLVEQFTCNIAFEGSLSDGNKMYEKRFNASVEYPSSQVLFVTHTILRYPIMHTIVYMAIISPIVYYLVYYFRAKINKALNLLTISEATKRQHRKLVKMLVLQAIVPVAAAGTLPLFFLSQQGVVTDPIWQFPCFLPLNTVSLLQPIIMLWAVEPYRKATIGMFWKPIKYRARTKNSTIVHSTIAILQ